MQFFNGVIIVLCSLHGLNWRLPFFCSPKIMQIIAETRAASSAWTSWARRRRRLSCGERTPKSWGKTRPRPREKWAWRWAGKRHLAPSRDNCDRAAGASVPIWTSLKIIGHQLRIQTTVMQLKVRKQQKLMNDHHHQLFVYILEDDKKPLTKQDIGSPMPLSEGVKTELAKKWMISDIKDIKSFTNSGPDSGVTSEGLLTNSNMTASGSTSKNKNTPSTCECGYQSSGVVCEDNNTGDLATRTQSVCSCSVLASTTPGGHK